jgi:hypothetical protein
MTARAAAAMRQQPMLGSADSNIRPEATGRQWIFGHAKTLKKLMRNESPARRAGFFGHAKARKKARRNASQEHAFFFMGIIMNPQCRSEAGEFGCCRGDCRRASPCTSANVAAAVRKSCHMLRDPPSLRTTAATAAATAASALAAVAWWGSATGACDGRRDSSQCCGATAAATAAMVWESSQPTLRAANGESECLAGCCARGGYKVDSPHQDICVMQANSHYSCRSLVFHLHERMRFMRWRAGMEWIRRT